MRSSIAFVYNINLVELQRKERLRAQQQQHKLIHTKKSFPFFIPLILLSIPWKSFHHCKSVVRCIKAKCIFNTHTYIYCVHSLLSSPIPMNWKNIITQIYSGEEIVNEKEKIYNI